jgi:hypothetical protein
VDEADHLTGTALVVVETGEPGHRGPPWNPSEYN